MKRRGEVLKKGQQKKMKPNSEWKKRKGKCKRKIQFKGSESHPPTSIDVNDFMTMTFRILEIISLKEVCISPEENLEKMTGYVTDAYDVHCGHTWSAVAILAISVQMGRGRITSKKLSTCSYSICKFEYMFLIIVLLFKFCSVILQVLSKCTQLSSEALCTNFGMFLQC
jgi:hypothetical protein